MADPIPNRKLRRVRVTGADARTLRVTDTVTGEAIKGIHSIEISAVAGKPNLLAKVTLIMEVVELDTFADADEFAVIGAAPRKKGA